MSEKVMKCGRCGVELENKKTFFNYLGHNFNTELPVCPVCGEVFIPEDLVRGRMSQVERELEDK